MTKIEKQNALKAIADKCRKEWKKVSPTDLPALKSITSKYGKQAELLGFDVEDMKYEIGIMNGVLVDRRMQ